MNKCSLKIHLSKTARVLNSYTLFQQTKGEEVTGYENKGLEDDQSGKEGETTCPGNGHSNGVVNDCVVVKMQLS